LTEKSLISEFAKKEKPAFFGIEKESIRVKSCRFHSGLTSASTARVDSSGAMAEAARHS
jgi:hypothetical protein